MAASAATASPWRNPNQWKTESLRLRCRTERPPLRSQALARALWGRRPYGPSAGGSAAGHHRPRRTMGGTVSRGKYSFFLSLVTRSRALASLARCPLPGRGVAGRGHSAVLQGAGLMPAVTPRPPLPIAACTALCVAAPAAPALAREVSPVPRSRQTPLVAPSGGGVPTELGRSEQETLASHGCGAARGVGDRGGAGLRRWPCPQAGSPAINPRSALPGCLGSKG